MKKACWSTFSVYGTGTEETPVAWVKFLNNLRYPTFIHKHFQACYPYRNTDKETSFCLLLQQWQQHNERYCSKSIPVVQDKIIKYLETTEKHTYRGDHEIIELHCIFTLKTVTFIPIQLKSLYLSDAHFMLTHLTW